MKKLCLAVAVLIAMGAALSAVAQPAPGGAPGGRRAGGQRPGGPGQAGGRGMRALSVATIPVEALKQALKLNDGQVQKIKAIQDQLRKDTMGMRPQGGGMPDPAAMEKRRALTQKAAKDIEALLTAEQKTALATVVRQMSAMRMVGIPPMALAELKLTADQKKKIQALVAPAMEQLKGIAPEERRTKMRAIMEEMRPKVAAILTPEQQKIVAKYMQRRGRGGEGGPGGPGAPGGRAGRGNRRGGGAGGAGAPL